MSIETIGLSLLSFALGGLFAGLFKGKGDTEGQELKKKQALVISSIKNEEFQKAVIGFMGKVNLELSSDAGKEKFEATLNRAITLLKTIVPGTIDDMIIDNILKPYIQGLYEGYLK